MSGFTDRFMPRLAALAVICLMAVAVNPEGDYGWLIFSFLGITLVLEFLAFRHGIATGMTIYKAATPEQRRELDKLLEGDN